MENHFPGNGGTPATFPGASDFGMKRSHGATLVRIAGHYVPRRSLLLAASESVLILAALVAGVAVRFRHLPAIHAFLAEPPNWVRFISVAAICQVALYYNEFYNQRAIHNRSALIIRAFRAVGIALLALSMLYYLFPPARLEREIMLVMAPLALVLTIGWRLALSAAQGLSQPLERVLVMGMGAPGIGVAREIMRRPELQYKVVGFLDENGEDIGKPLVSPGIMGGISQVQEVVERENIDRVVIALAERRGVMPTHQLTELKLQGLPIEDARTVYERLTGRIMLEQLQLSWLILSDGFHKSAFLFAAKRAIDMVASFFLLIVFSPLMLAIAMAILLESGRPIFFRQERVGLGGRVFKILKFRSMRQGSDKGTPKWTADGDPRITRLGGFIRKFRLDELPQLVNILRGEMSLIGPRPEVPYFCELLEREIPYFNQRHSVRPGLSGWAQVKYQYGASLEEAKVKFEFDLFYIKHLSILLDFVILLETLKVVLLGRGAK